MSGPALWMVGGLVLVALEMVAPGVFMLPLGLAAIGTGLLTLLHPAVHWQLAAFVALAVCSGLAIGRRRPVADRVNAPAAGLVGQMCRAIAFADGQGRVRLGDGQWQARLRDGSVAVLPDQALWVVGLDGTVLLVSASEGE